SSRILVNTVLQCFAIGNAIIVYFAGMWTTPGPMALVVGLLAGALLFGWLPAVAALATSAVLAITIGILEVQGILPYAPLLKSAPFEGGELSMWWRLNVGGTTVVYMILSLILVYLVLSQRRERESALYEAFDQLQSEHTSLRLENLSYASLVKALDTLPLGVTVSDRHGKIIYSNPVDAAMHGYQQEELPGRYASILATGGPGRPVDPSRLESLRGFKRETTNVRRDGSIFPVQLTSEILTGENGEPVGIVTVCEDIAERRAMEERLKQSEARLKLVMQGTNDGIWDWDLEEDRIYFSERWLAMLGYKPGEIGATPEDWFSRIHPEEREDIKSQIWFAVQGDEGHLQVEYRMLHKDGSFRWVMSRGAIARDGEGRAFRVTGSQTDLTERSAYDPLTGLPNLLLFTERLGRVLHRAQMGDQDVCAALFIDLDDFKRMNDSYGQSVADRLLFAVAARLSDALGAGRTLARLAGDEFLVLAEGMGSEDDIENLIITVREALAQGFTVGNHEIFITASIGVSILTAEHKQPDEVLRDARAAMHRAKQGGGGQVEYYSKRLRAEVRRRVELEKELRYAVERGEFLVFYQPLVRLSDTRLMGFEALVRWNHPEHGIIGPGHFIDVAEETDLIFPLGLEVLRTACAQVNAWGPHIPSGADFSVSVNLSGKQFRQHDLAEQVAGVLRESGVPGNMLKLEITESLFLDDPNRTREILDRLKRLDTTICIDDFGTGYSSLSYLQQFPIDVLKIDKSFVDGISTSRDNLEIVRAVVQLARSLQMLVIAEGIEQPEQANLLKSLHCDIGQGYHWSKPLPADAATDYLVRNFETVKAG
ncbi:MAG: EAL domain-containing protein, partial [Chrysiogenetes bacterium]|nr:EAL domain-containing protein [Chrysiogenetes bacterium]